MVCCFTWYIKASNDNDLKHAAGVAIYTRDATWEMVGWVKTDQIYFQIKRRRVDDNLFWLIVQVIFCV